MAREKRKQSTKRRQIILDERDEIAFTRVLREKYPNIGFVEQILYSPSECTTKDWFSTCHPLGVIDAFVPDEENWQPTFHPSSEDGKHTLQLPRRTFTITRSHWLWALCDGQWGTEHPTLEPSSISGAYCRGTDDDVWLFLDSVWRLLEKITVRVDGVWCGFHALRWASENPERTLNRTSRPAQEWVFPKDNPYYRDELWDDAPPHDRRLQPMYLYSSE